MSNLKQQLSVEKKAELIADIERRSDINAQLVENWIGNLCYIIDEIAKPNAKSTQPLLEGMFWIRLAGVLVEIKDNFIKLPKFLDCSTIEEVVQKYSPGQRALKIIALTFEINECIKTIQSKFTEQELVMIDYLRQTNSHPVQKGYQIGLSGNVLRDTYEVKTIPKIFKIQDIDQILTTIMKQYKAVQWNIAYDMASKISKEMNLLYLMVKRFHTF